MKLQINSKFALAATLAMGLSATFLTTGSYAGQFANNHPRRAEVLGRNRRTNGRLNADRGHLDGHYGQLKSENHAIRQQEQTDARANGGYITKGQQHQLNQEHNQLNRQIHQDH